MKLTVPLIDLIGLKLESTYKLDLAKSLDGIKDKTNELMVRYGISV